MLLSKAPQTMRPFICNQKTCLSKNVTKIYRISFLVEKSRKDAFEKFRREQLEARKGKVVLPQGDFFGEVKSSKDDLIGLLEPEADMSKAKEMSKGKPVKQVSKPEMMDVSSIEAQLMKDLQAPKQEQPKQLSNFDFQQFIKSKSGKEDEKIVVTNKSGTVAKQTTPQAMMNEESILADLKKLNLGETKGKTTGGNQKKVSPVQQPIQKPIGPMFGWGAQPMPSIPSTNFSNVFSLEEIEKELLKSKK